MSVVMAGVHEFLERGLHELGHLVGGIILGLSPRFVGGEIIVPPAALLSPAVRYAFYLSGGLFAGAVLLLGARILKGPYRYGLLPLAAAELSYAPFDSTTIGDGLGLAAFAISVGAIAGSLFVRYAGSRRPPRDALRPLRMRRFSRCLSEYLAWLDGRPLPGA